MIPHKYGHICVGFFLTPFPKSPQYATVTSSEKKNYNTQRSWDKESESVNVRPYCPVIKLGLRAPRKKERKVELTDGCCSGGDSQGLPG